MTIDSPSRAPAPLWRIIAAFSIAPGAAALLMALSKPEKYAGLHPIDQVWRTARMYALFGAYPAAVMLGIPAFLMLRKKLHPSPVNCALVGAVTASLPWLIVMLFFPPQYAGIGDRATVIDYTRTAYGWQEMFLTIFKTALFGACGGFIFWVIAVSGSSLRQTPSQA
ncbi:hypothetical protein [Methylobacterium sp. R2-1]|uniref:hypothetical protein n=1 Tax=Methylobacterium sp. R2-1 TaxID=2587064 RepID=UPI0017AF767A|nr:hypothetical protein [Methylobacterium sp. R2-1]MBB2961189.1 hypothetical protein [Methylobacterium sp. R2-1]